ncbi:hypothetical protein B0H14DRAFT_3157760 [Mycena olivaceomarginata]|nr:hypothetical protein B0H14DRAFT_3157760 [Mycena olivaceomarginata]
MSVYKSLKQPLDGLAALDLSGNHALQLEAPNDVAVSQVIVRHVQDPVKRDYRNGESNRPLLPATKLEENIAAPEELCITNGLWGARGFFSDMRGVVLLKPKIYGYLQKRTAQLANDHESLKCSGRKREENIQILWKKYKNDFTEEGKQCSRFLSEKSRQIRTWNAQKSIVIHDEDMSVQDKHLAILHLEEKIDNYLRDEAERKKKLCLKLVMILKVKL